jgi:hypothetical protein
MDNNSTENIGYRKSRIGNNNQWSTNTNSKSSNNNHHKKKNRPKNDKLPAPVKNIEDIERAFQFEPNDIALKTFPNHAQQSFLNFSKQMNEDDYNFYGNRSQFENELKKTNPNNKHDFQFLFAVNFNKYNNDKQFQYH